MVPLRVIPPDVVITGIGWSGPLGADRETLWRRLLAGDRGVRKLDESDFHGVPVAEPASISLAGAPAPIRDDARAPVLRLIETAAEEAFDHAGLAPARSDHGSIRPAAGVPARHPAAFDPLRAGCVIGTSKGSLVAFGRAFAALRAGKAADDWADFAPHVASARVAARFGLKGPCLAPVAACATGLVSVLRGLDLIQDGACDLVLAGSGDASLYPAVLASFRRMGVLATRHDDPAAACRPFNRDRDGFAVGEGAALFVLERRDHAAARGAASLATLLGGAVLSDPSGLIAVDPRGETLTRAVRDTLARSGLSPGDVGHVNLHGTATRSNDLAESAGLRAALGNRLDHVPCVALKGALGHQLGAAGAAELAASVLALRDGRLPPTANLTDPDPACDLSLSREAVPVRGCGLKLSLGFGGHVAVACLAPP